MRGRPDRQPSEPAREPGQAPPLRRFGTLFPSPIHQCTTMGQIALEGLEFFAFHGYYDEEQKIGNKYGVDLYIKTDLLAAGESDKLTQTVNYEVLYRLVAEEMRAPARLLEHVAHRVLDRITAELPHVRKVKVSVSKFNPPLGGICHRARVTLVKRRERQQ